LVTDITNSSFVKLKLIYLITQTHHENNKATHKKFQQRTHWRHCRYLWSQSN